MNKTPDFKMSADTRFIQKELSKLKVGEFIAYSDLEKVTSRKLDEIRGSIETARRALMRDEQMVFDVVRGSGLRRLNDGEIVDSTTKDIAGIRRRAKKGFKKLIAIQDFNAMTPKQQLDHSIRASALSAIAEVSTERSMKKLEDAAQKSLKQLPFKDTLALFSSK